jgi:hypothetical protein
VLTQRVLGAVLLISGLVLLTPVAAVAGPGECDRSTNPWCDIENDEPEDPGPPGGGGGGASCTFNGQSVPCTDPDFGFYIGGGCYWKALVPQPIHAPPAGQDPTKGAWGVASCYTAPGSGVATQSYRWLEDPQAGPSPAELAQQALAKIHLLGARIGIVPDPNGSGAVGLPVWLWTDVNPGTWGPLTASASGGGITVTITARAQRINWAMGDGRVESCDNPGTPYEDRYGNSMSPTCGYRYTDPSVRAANSDGRYTITATTHWTVDWAGGGQTGVLTPTSQSQTSIRIGEIPVVGAS